MGVVKTLISAWIKTRRKKYSLSKDNIAILEERLLSLKSNIPREFSRKPRSFFDLDRWKAVEFRQFLLDTGPIILKGVLPEHHYNHFLKLSIAVRTLLHTTYCLSNNMCARELITDFVNEIPDLYDVTMVKFNFHCLLHLPDGVLYFGENLDTFGAFKFENHLYKVKRMVRKGNNVATQIYNRLVERRVLVNNAERKEMAVSTV